MTAPRLILISAWNDSGGGFTHRLFDGHPSVMSWPFELQLGTAGRHDSYHGQFHDKYRWPAFADLNAPADTLFDAIIDEELKSVLRGGGAKHDDYAVDVSLDAWRGDFGAALRTRDRAGIVTAYMTSFFASWRDRRSSGGEDVMLGHCPNLILDGDEILADFPGAKILHVVRDPRAGFADLRRRHPDMTPERYAVRWNAVNAVAFDAARKYPHSVMILWFADMLANREAVLRHAANFCGLQFVQSLLTPSWNSRALDEGRMGPFGGVPEVGIAREQEVIASLAADEAARITTLCRDVQALMPDGAPG